MSFIRSGFTAQNRLENSKIFTRRALFQKNNLKQIKFLGEKGAESKPLSK
jgi:hypothetical protein